MLALLLTLLVAEAGPPPPPPPPPPAAPAAPAADAAALAPIAEMRAAVEDRDIARYQAAWLPKGWSSNLVGGSGLSGEAAAGQAKADGWVFRADPATLARHTEADVWVVRCDVVTLEEAGKVLDSVFAAIARHDGRYVVYGAGEDLEQVTALAGRIAAGGKLAPPPPQLPDRRPPPPERR